MYSKCIPGCFFVFIVVIILHAYVQLVYIDLLSAKLTIFLHTCIFYIWTFEERTFNTSLNSTQKTG